MSRLTAFLISLLREWNEIYTLTDCLRASTFKSNYYITGLRKGWSCKDWDELKFIHRLLTGKTGGSIFQIKNIYSYNTQMCHVFFLFICLCHLWTGTPIWHDIPVSPTTKTHWKWTDQSSFSFLELETKTSIVWLVIVTGTGRGDVRLFKLLAYSRFWLCTFC